MYNTAMLGKIQKTNLELFRMIMLHIFTIEPWWTLEGFLMGPDILG